MPPSKTEKPRAEKRPAVFFYEQVICTRRAEAAIPGPYDAATTAAVQAGRRVAGEPYVEKVERLDDAGVNALVVWAVPVEAA